MDCSTMSALAALQPEIVRLNLCLGHSLEQVEQSPLGATTSLTAERVER